MKNKKIKLAVSLVTYNAERYLPFLLNSLNNQTFQDFSLLVIDNGSTDRTIAYLKENYPPVKVVAHPRNLGFAESHNQAIAWTESDYVCVLNQDVVLEPDYFKIIIDFLEKHLQVGAAAGKILTWDFENNEKTRIIDSLGLVIFKSHRAIDKAQGRLDEGEFESPEEIFGVSAAVAVYRRNSLERIKIKAITAHEEYFDESFFSYKEDVDLAYRLRLNDWQAWYLPQAIAYHDRNVKGQANLSDRATHLARQDKDRLVRIYSYKNHLLTLVKNEFFGNFFKFFLPIFWYEFKKFIYLLFFEQSTLKGLVMFFAQLGLALKKRRYIIKNIRKVKAPDLAKWYQ